METQFKYLSLGARFSFGQLESIFVKLNKIQVVRWNPHEVIQCFESPHVFEIAHPDTVVVVRERYPEHNHHEFPKTAYQEGYHHYIVHPRWSDNPYTKGSQDYNEFARGYFDADWEDTI